MWRDGLVLSGVENFTPKRNESSGMRYYHFENWLCDILTVDVSLVIFEMAFQKSQASREVFLGLVTTLKKLCALRHIDHTSIGASSLKKWMTGSGRAGKPRMIEAARDRWAGQDIVDDNQADALCLLAYALAEIVPTTEAREGSET